MTFLGEVEERSHGHKWKQWEIFILDTFVFYTDKELWAKKRDKASGYFANIEVELDIEDVFVATTLVQATLISYID